MLNNSGSFKIILGQGWDWGDQQGAEEDEWIDWGSSGVSLNWIERVDWIGLNWIETNELY